MLNLKHKKIVIGLDQSYENCGISIAVDGKLKRCTSLRFKTTDTKSEKRRLLRERLGKLFITCLFRAGNVTVIFERIRLFSGGNINQSYLIETGKLIGSILDKAYQCGITCYSVDTRSWKSKILGSSKTFDKYADWEKPEKAAAIEFIQALGFDCRLLDKNGNQKIVTKGKKKGTLKWNDDMADSGCIALYGFLPESQQKLQLEE